MRPQIVTILTFMLFLVNGISMLGQTNSAKSGPPPPNSGRGPLLPIDTDLYLLLFAGIILGLYFILRRAKATNTPV